MLLPNTKKDKDSYTTEPLVCVTAIEECVAVMPSEMSEILKLHYFQKMSLRSMSKKFFLGRDALARRRDKAIAVVSECLSDL